MSTLPPPEPPPEAPGPRRLTRSTSDRVLAGVCGGTARYFGVDPVIVRIVAIALIFFGGAGALLYLAAVLLVPNEGEAGGPSPDRNKVLVVLGVIALLAVAVPLVAAPVFIAGALIFPLAFVLLAALVVAWLVTGRWPEREAGPVARAAALGLGVLLVLCCVAAGAFWAAAAGGDEVVAGFVIAAGVALLLGAFVRPVRWLIPLALALAIPAGFAQAADVDLDGGVGEKHYRPLTEAQIRDHYEIGMGEMTVDLRAIDLRAGSRTIDLDVGIGEARVIVRRDVCVVTQAEAGIGAITVFGRQNHGVDVSVDDVAVAPPGTATLVVRGDVGIGQLQVRHDDFGDDWSGPGPHRRGGPIELGDQGNAACA